MRKQNIKETSLKYCCSHERNQQNTNSTIKTASKIAEVHNSNEKLKQQRKAKNTQKQD